MAVALDEVLFYAANAAALPGWALNVAAPRAALTQRLARAQLLPLAAAVIYVVAFALSVGEGGDGSFFSLDGVAELFSHRAVVLVGWVHYLSFDLAVGNWMLLDSQRRGVHHGWMVPCLLLTLNLGPSGLLLYAPLRWWYGRRGEGSAAATRR